MAFDLRRIPKRFFEFVNPDSGKLLHLEQPKLKILKQLEDMQREDASIGELTATVAKIISKNREHFRVDADRIQEWMTLDDMIAFTKEFVAWLKDTRQKNPN